jgi:TolB protein
MTRKAGRQYTVAAVMATSLAVAAACSTQVNHPTAAPAPASTTPAGADQATTPAGADQATTPAGADQPAAPVAEPTDRSALTVTDGSSTVITGDRTAHFASTVTGGSWSSDGSRLAYVDGDGNIATARADGSGVTVLTRTDRHVKRAHPTWMSGGFDVSFTERGTDGVWRLKYVEVGATTGEAGMWGLASESNNTAPSAVSSSRTAAGPGQYLLAYQHKGARGPQVWIVDFNQREPNSVMFADGSDPAPSPDGRSVAYVGHGGQLFVRPVAGKSAARQVTFGVKGLRDAAWTPDGARLAFATAADIESVSVKVAAGVKTNPTTVESRRPGVPAYRPLARTSVNRFAGTDPIADAIALSKLRWNPFNSPHPFISEGDGGLVAPVVTIVGVADTLAVSVRPEMPAPLLFTGKDALDPRVAAELKRVLGDGSDPDRPRLVQIVGGTDVVSAKVEQTLTGLGYQVTRTADGGNTTPPPAALDLQYQNSVALVAARDWSARLAAVASGIPVITVPANQALPATTANWLAANGAALSNVLVFGAGITPSTVDGVVAAVAGPAGAAAGALIFR